MEDKRKSSSNVTRLYTKDAAKNPDNVLEQALDNYDRLLIVGYNKEGNLDLRASTNCTGEDLLWLTEHSKLLIMNLEEFE